MSVIRRSNVTVTQSQITNKTTVTKAKLYFMSRKDLPTAHRQFFIYPRHLVTQETFFFTWKPSINKIVEITDNYMNLNQTDEIKLSF